MRLSRVQTKEHYKIQRIDLFFYLVPSLLFLFLYVCRVNQRLLIGASLAGYIIFYLLYRRELRTLMFLTLTGFLAAPAICSFICVVILDGYVSIFFEAYQTVEKTVQIQILTLIALFAHGFGWSFGLLAAKRSYEGQIVSKTYAKKLSRLNPLYLFIFFIVAASFSGWQAGVSRVPIWEGAYGQASSGHNRVLSLGIYPTWAVANLIVAYVLLRKHFPGDKAMRVIWLSALLFVVGYEFLAKGRRLEVVAFVIAFFAVKFVIDKRTVSLFRVFLFSFAVLILVNLMEPIRSTLHLGSIQGNAIRRSLKFTRMNESGIHVNRISTIGPITATFYRAVGDIDDRVYDYLCGSSYVEFIPRTLPEFIYPDRPRAIVWEHSAQGGIFALAEAYLNFGALGCFIVPLFLSFVLSRFVYGKVVFLRNPSWWELGWYGLLTAALVRGIWYQLFTLYKSWIATLVLWVLVCIVTSFHRKHLLWPIFAMKERRMLPNLKRSSGMY